MIRVRYLFRTALILAAVLACETRSAAGDSSPPVRPDGIGAVRVGMTLREASRALGEDMIATYATFESCDHVVPQSLPRGTALMVVKDTIVRIEVREPDVRTEAGAEIGTSEARLLELYGDRAVVTPHKYDGPEWHYVTVHPSADSTHAIIFETDGQEVRSFRAGRQPEVSWVEGCA